MSDLEGFMAGLQNLGRSNQAFSSAVPNIPGQVRVPERRGRGIQNFFRGLTGAAGIAGGTIQRIEQAEQERADRERKLKQQAFQQGVENLRLMQVAEVPMGKQVDAVDALLKINNPEGGMSESEKESLKALGPEFTKAIVDFETTGNVTIPPDKLVQLQRALPFQSPLRQQIFDRMLQANERQLQGRSMAEAFKLLPPTIRESDLVNTITEEELGAIASETDPTRAVQLAHQVAAAHIPPDRFAEEDVLDQIRTFNSIGAKIPEDSQFIAGLVPAGPQTAFQFLQGLFKSQTGERKDPLFSMDSEERIATILAKEETNRPLSPVERGFLFQWQTKNGAEAIGVYQQALDQGVAAQGTAKTLEKDSEERIEVESAAQNMILRASRGMSRAANIMSSLETGAEVQSTQQYLAGIMDGMVQRTGGQPMKEEHFAAEIVSGFLTHPRTSGIPATELFDQLVNKVEGEGDSPIVLRAKEQGILDPRKKVNYNRIRNAVDPLFDARLQQALKEAEGPAAAAPPEARFAEEVLQRQRERFGGFLGGAARTIGQLFRGAGAAAPGGETPFAELFQAGEGGAGFGQFLRQSQEQQQAASLVPEEQARTLTGR
jgi:hypothetical protein